MFWSEMEAKGPKLAALGLHGSSSEWRSSQDDKQKAGLESGSERKLTSRSERESKCECNLEEAEEKIGLRFLG